MKVILMSDVKKVGKKNEIVEVSDGYAKNFLFKKKMAIPCSDNAMKILKDEQNTEKKYQDKLKKEAIKLKEELKDKEFVFEVSATNGRVSNSISTKQIAESLAKQGYVIDKRKFLDHEPVNTLGYSILKIELYKNVIGEIKILLKEQN